MLTKPFSRATCRHVMIILFCSLFAIAAQAQTKNWALVMSKYSKYSRQVWLKKSFFPREDIKRYWKMGYAITSVSYGDKKWIVVLSKGSGYSPQSWATRDKFPQDKINDYWRRGYSVTSLAYGNGLWAVVASKHSRLTRQYWTTNAVFPGNRISEYWDKGYAVTNMFYGQGKWAVMMSRGSEYGTQTWVKSSSFPAARIKQKWSQGYSITNVAYGAGQWLIMLSKNTGYKQSWALRNNFPGSRIDAYWKKGYAITGIIQGIGGASNNNSVVTTTKPKPVIRWNSPNTTYTASTRNSRYPIDVCIKSSSGVSNVKVYINGRLQTTRGFEVVKANSCAKNVQKTLSLSKGINTIKVSATNAGGTVSSTRRVRYIAQATENTVVKASIRWTSPSSFSTSTNDRNYTLNACIKSPSRVRSVKVYVNGVAQNTRGFEVVTANDCAKSLRKTIALQKGNNRVSVVVTNAAGTATSRRTINYESLSAGNPTNKRVALIIGNANYTNAPLKNPANDAKAMANALRGLGFEVIEHINANQETMETAITSFGNRIKKGGVGLFYFAGHGLQVNGENYLIPLKAKIDKEQQVKYRSVNLGLVLAEMDAASNPMNIVILDACRNNPFKTSSRSANRGLASTTAPTGTFIAYATAPGSVAADGNGANGLYTQELLKMLRVPGLTIEQVFKKVRAKVLQQTGGKQTPWENSSIIGDFYFKR